MPGFVKYLFLPSCFVLGFILGYLLPDVPGQPSVGKQKAPFKRAKVYLPLEEKMLPPINEISEQSSFILTSQNKGSDRAPKNICLLSKNTYRIAQLRPHPFLEINKIDLNHVSRCFVKANLDECKLVPVAQSFQYPNCQEIGRVIYGNF